MECEKISSPGYIADTIKVSKKNSAYILLANICEEIIPKLGNNLNIYKYFFNVEKFLRILVNDLPVWPYSYRFLARNLWFQGKIVESFIFFKKAEEANDCLKERFLKFSKKQVFLPRNCAEIIGLMGHLDSFIKHKILNKDQRKYVLFVDKKNIINKCFLDYFKKYIDIIDLKDIKDRNMLNIEHLISEDWNWIFKNNNSVQYTHQFMAKTQTQWNLEKRQPILKLKKSHSKILKKYLNNLGYKKDDWHLCVHIRSEDFYNEENNTAQSFRNSPIEDYYLLFEKIVELGGWVFRMGDSSMPKIKKSFFKKGSDKIIDFANSEFKSDVLDVALCATCKLFVSSPSGLHTVSHAFGKPTCYVNFPIYAGFPWHNDEILLPKKYLNTKNKKMLSIDQIYKSNLPYCNHGFMFELKKITLLKNDPVEILDAVLEALIKVDEKLNINFNLSKLEKKKVQYVHSKIDKIDKQLNLQISGKLSSKFCIKYFNKIK